MINFLLSWGLGGFTITDILNQWAQFGVFAYVFPFLLIFAIIFGILNKTEILGDNKGVQAVIAIAIGFLALQNDYVNLFFASIFPYAGMGIAVLIVAVILMGVMFDSDKNKGLNWIKYVFFLIGIIIFLVVTFTSLSDISWWGMGGYGWAESWPAILSLIVLLAIIGFVIFGDKIGNRSGTPGH